ncbi:MAG: hypothetical protein RLZZ333_1650, partial [Bacteroidota bacterium]
NKSSRHRTKQAASQKNQGIAVVSYSSQNSIQSHTKVHQRNNATLLQNV